MPLPAPSAQTPLKHPPPPIIGLKKKRLVTGVDIERVEQRTFLHF